MQLQDRHVAPLPYSVSWKQNLKVCPLLRAEVHPRVWASRGREIKNQPGNPDINKLLQHAHGGTHYHLTMVSVFHRSLPEEVVFKARPRASLNPLSWSSSRISNHQGLLFRLLSVSWSFSSLHLRLKLPPAPLHFFSLSITGHSYTVERKFWLQCIFMLHLKLVSSQALGAIRPSVL